jgi:hypothetical protein
MNTDSTALVAVTATSLVVSVLLYVWTAIALSALFRKSGEAAWKGWVPVYNLGVLFQLAGYPWWSVLLILLPVAGPVIVFVVFVLAAHRVGRAFGYGGGMTVLAVLLPPVWATVLGFGSARWIGADDAGAPRRRTHGDVADPVYARGFDGTPASFGVAEEAAESQDGERPAAAGLAGWAPTRAPEQPPADAASTPAAETSEARSPFADWWPEVLDEDPDTDSAVDDRVPGALLDEKPSGDDDDDDDDGGAAAPPPPAVTAAPVIAPPRPADLPGVDSAAEPAVEDREEVPPPLRRSTARPAWNGFDLSVPGEFTGEVTDAVPGAPAPISAVPSAPVVDESHPPVPPERPAPREFVEPSVPPEPAEPAASPENAEPAAPGEPTSSPAVPPAPPAAPTPPPVTRAPAVARDAAAPSSSDDDAFPDDGGVSAIVGAPVAGSPLSARSSVSARFADVSRDEELADHTIVTRRRRTGWVLVAPGGERIPLSEEVAIVGRRPSVDAAFPQAQLITVGDPTRTVSKTHARLELRGDVWAVVDLDSTNGVVLIADNDDETDVEPGAVTRLTPRFLLGDAELRLEEAAAS